MVSANRFSRKAGHVHESIRFWGLACVKRGEKADQAVFTLKDC